MRKVCLFSLFLIGYALIYTKALEECSPKNLQLRNASQGQWYLLPDGSFHYEFPHCQLRRFTATTATQCLQGSHIVFMGDSLSRYFYLSLALLFARGEWSNKFAQLPSHPSLPKSILSERDFQNWSLFYHKSNKLLNHGKHSIEVCDCFRNDSVPFMNLRMEDPHQQTDCIENRHFRYLSDHPADLNNQEMDVRLSYIQWYGPMPIRGHSYLSFLPRNASLLTYLKEINHRLCPDHGESFYPLSKLCYEQRVKRKYQATDWFDELHTLDFPSDFFHQLDDCDQIYHSERTKCQKLEREVLQPLGTTHLILNIGWHAGLEHADPRFLEKVVDGGRKYFATPGPSYSTRKASNTSSETSKLSLAKVVWRSATHGAIFHNEADKKVRSFLDQLEQKPSQQHQGQKSEKLFDYFEVHELTKVLRTYHLAITQQNYAQLEQIIKPSPSWPKDLPVNYTAIPTTWVDHAHLEPWVYAQIHDIFLNAVCPLPSS